MKFFRFAAHWLSAALGIALRAGLSLALGALLIAQPTDTPAPFAITKEPAAKFLLAMDFTQWIQADGIALASITAINTRTGADSTSLVIGTSPVPAVIPGTDRIAFMVQGGEPGDLHHITVLATDLTTGAQYPGKVDLSISNWP